MNLADGIETRRVVREDRTSERRSVSDDPGMTVIVQAWVVVGAQALRNSGKRECLYYLKAIRCGGGLRVK
jgi:hypothetical protein